MFKLPKNTTIIFLGIISLAFFGVAGVVSAAPIVTGVTGDLTNGAVLTVVGSGFGTKTTATPWRWDPIEGVSQYSGLNDGNSIPVSTGGYWDNNQGPLLYNTTAGEQRGISTANVATANPSTSCPGGEDNRKLSTTLPDSSFNNETYVSYWIWHSTTMTNENTKTIRFWNDNSGTSRLSLTPSWANNGPWVVYRYDNGGYCYNSPVLPGNFIRPIGGEWERVELYLKQETTPDTSNDGEIWTAQTAAGKISSWSSGNIDETCNSSTARLRWLTFGHDKNCTGAGATSNINIRMDDIYIDSTRARVEIGNASTWSANTHREIQIPSAWSADSATVTLNQGSFDTLEGKYLYVVGADGNVNANGYLLTTTDTTVPTQPTNLSAITQSSSQINLTWATSTDNVGVAGYNIYRDGVQIATSTTTSYSNTGLTASTTYSYTVSAYDAAGNESAQSTAASATTQTPPPALKGDFNSDSKVNNLDFTSFKNAFKSIFNSIFDLNSDSIIDVKDLGVLMSGWLP